MTDKFNQGDKAKEYPYPFSLRLTFEERVTLTREAGDMPLGTFIRKKALDGHYSKKRRRRSNRPIQDEQALSHLLGELGKARLANNLNQLAKAAHTGSLPLTPETEHALDNACADIKWMREQLMKVLGYTHDIGGPS